MINITPIWYLHLQVSRRGVFLTHRKLHGSSFAVLHIFRNRKAGSARIRQLRKQFPPVSYWASGCESNSKRSAGAAGRKLRRYLGRKQSGGDGWVLYVSARDSTRLCLVILGQCPKCSTALRMTPSGSVRTQLRLRPQQRSAPAAKVGGKHEIFFDFLRLLGESFALRKC